MRKNAHKYLAFASVNFLKRLYSSGEKLYLSNSIIFLNFYRRIKWVKSISSPMRLKKNFTEGNSKHCKQAQYFLTGYCHGNNIQTVNNNTYMIARML